MPALIGFLILRLNSMDSRLSTNETALLAWALHARYKLDQSLCTIGQVLPWNNYIGSDTRKWTGNWRLLSKKSGYIGDWRLVRSDIVIPYTWGLDPKICKAKGSIVWKARERIFDGSEQTPL